MNDKNYEENNVSVDEIKIKVKSYLIFLFYCICMSLRGVAVLEPEGLHGHKKGPDLRTLRWSKEPSHRSKILAILHSRQPTY